MAKPSYGNIYLGIGTETKCVMRMGVSFLKVAPQRIEAVFVVASKRG